MGNCCTEVAKKAVVIVEKGAQGDTGPKGDDGLIGLQGAVNQTPGETFEAVQSADKILTSNWEVVTGCQLTVSDAAKGYLLFFSATASITDALSEFEIKATIDGGDIPYTTRKFGGGGLSVNNEFCVEIQGKVGEPLPTGTLKIECRGLSTPPGCTLKEGILHLLEIKRT